MTLVTGATGNIGSGVVQALRERGAPVRAFVRDEGKAKERLGPGVVLAVGDLAEPDSIRRALEGVETVFIACSNQPAQAELEIAAIDACGAAGVRRIVKLSAVGAEIGSPLAFWDAHGRIEEHLRQSGIPAVVLRPTSYMSNLFTAADQIRAMGRFFAPVGDARLALVDPRDVAAVAAVALRGGYDGDVLTLSGPESITYVDAAAALSEAIDKPVEFVDVPEEAARQGMAEAGLPDWLADNLVVLFRFIRKGFADLTTDTVKAVTGRPPRTFTQFARDQARVFL